MAILSGLIAQLAADFYGFVAPFDCSIVALSVMGIILMCTWEENYGDEEVALSQSFVEAMKLIQRDKKVMNG